MVEQAARIVHGHRSNLRGLLKTLWGWSIALATAFALLGATQDYASRIIEGQQANFTRLAVQHGINWFAWAALTPLIVHVWQRIIRQQGRLRIVLAGGPFGLAVLFTHSAMEVFVARSVGAVAASMPLATMLFARFTATLAPNLVILGMIVLAFHAMEHQRDSRARAEREAALQAQLATAQLRGLQMQLQPHFLFNTLHTASALMADDVAGARRVLTQLGDLLRASLAHGESQKVPLAIELDTLAKYLDIQRVRFEDRLTVDIRVEPAALLAAVPHLLLQPLVENAMQHAVEPRKGKAVVRVEVARIGNELHLEVADDGPGLDPHRPNGQRSGIGMANTRERLGMLYGKAQRFELARAREGGLSVRIVVPFELGDDADSTRSSAPSR